VKVYITKYALTSGIVEEEAEVPENPDQYAAGRIFVHHRALTLGHSAFASREEAEAMARRMAVKKIASLTKQLFRLDALAKTPKWADK